MSLRGLPVTPASLRAGASRGSPEGGVGPQKSQQFCTPLHERRGERGGEGRAPAHPPLARTGSACRSSRAPRSQTPSLLIGGRGDAAAAAGRAHTAPGRESPEGTRRWRQKAGRGPRGPGCGASSSSRPPGHPSPREPVGRRRPQAAGRTAPRLAGLCARTRKGWGRRESAGRAGWGPSSHVDGCPRWRDPLVLSTPRAVGFVPSRLAMKTSLSVCSQLRFAWPGMARGKIWPGDSDSVTLGAKPGVGGLVGSFIVQATVSVSSPHLYTHFIIRSVSWRLDFRNLFFPKSGAPDAEIQNPALISLVPWAWKRTGCQLTKIRSGNEAQ